MDKVKVKNDYGMPGPKAPPKNMQLAAQAERARRKACHGNWHDCGVEHPA